MADEVPRTAAAAAVDASADTRSYVQQLLAQMEGETQGPGGSEQRSEPLVIPLSEGGPAVLGLPPLAHRTAGLGGGFGAGVGGGGDLDSECGSVRTTMAVVAAGSERWGPAGLGPRQRGSGAGNGAGGNSGAIVADDRAWSLCSDVSATLSWPQATCTSTLSIATPPPLSSPSEATDPSIYPSSLHPFLGDGRRCC